MRITQTPPILGNGYRIYSQILRKDDVVPEERLRDAIKSMEDKEREYLKNKSFEVLYSKIIELTEGVVKSDLAYSPEYLESDAIDGNIKSIMAKMNDLTRATKRLALKINYASKDELDTINTQLLRGFTNA